MGNGAWTDTTTSTPFQGDTLALLLGGASFTTESDGKNPGSDGLWYPSQSSFTDEDSKDWHRFAGFQLVNEVGAGNTQQREDLTAQTADFGVLRAAARAFWGGGFQSGFQTGNTYAVEGQEDGYTQYVKGPFYRLSKNLEAVWGARLTDWDDFTAVTGSHFANVPAGYAIPDFTTLLSNYKSSLIPTETFIGAINAEWEDMLTALSSGLSVPTLPDIGTWSWPTAPTVSLGSHTMGTIASPTAVTVADNVDAAVDSFTALANTRLTADQAQLRASLFSTRQAMTSTFDGALAILAANAAAQIADYDKSARLDQARTQAQADMEHQRLLLQRNSQLEQLSLESSKVNVDAASKTADLDLAWARAIPEMKMRATEVSASVYGTTVAARADVLRNVYSFVNNGSSAAAGLVNSWLDANIKAGALNQDTHFRKYKEILEARNITSGAISAMAEARWKAQIQRLMVMKEAVSTFTPGMGSTVEHHPSTFSKIESGLGMVGGIASTIIQAVLAFS